MRTIKTLAIALLLLIGQGCNTKVEKQENIESDKSELDARQEVLASHENRRVAMLNEDADAVATMLTDDITLTHSSAAVETKEQFINALKTRKLRYKTLDDEDRQIRINGSTGVISGTCHIVVEASGTEYDVRLRYTEVWVKQGDTWRLMLWHSTKV